MLELLHNDEASRERVRRMVRDNEAVKKARSYSEKAALLAPRNPESHIFQAMISSLLEDAAAMKQVAVRAQASQLDGTDPKQLEAMATYTGRLAALLQQPARQRQAATWAVAGSAERENPGVVAPNFGSNRASASGFVPGPRRWMPPAGTRTEDTAHG